MTVKNHSILMACHFTVSTAPFGLVLLGFSSGRHIVTEGRGGAVGEGELYNFEQLPATSTTAQRTDGFDYDNNVIN